MGQNDLLDHSDPIRNRSAVGKLKVKVQEQIPRHRKLDSRLSEEGRFQTLTYWAGLWQELQVWPRGGQGKSKIEGLRIQPRQGHGIVATGGAAPRRSRKRATRGPRFDQPLLPRRGNARAGRDALIEIGLQPAAPAGAKGEGTLGVGPPHSAPAGAQDCSHGWSEPRRSGTPRNPWTAVC